MVSRTSLAVGALVLVVAAGCGSGNDDAATADDDEPTTTTTTAPPTTSSTVAPPTSGGGGTGGPSISLKIDVTPSPGAAALSATVSCAGSAEGTGFLAGPAATAACDHLRAEAGATRRLVEGPADLLCTEIYGGPEVAHVTGTINGQAIDTKITRTDGCGIADWTTLGALLTPAS